MKKKTGGSWYDKFLKNRKHSIAYRKKIVQANFRKYIRLRDTDKNGWGNCITCKARIKNGSYNCQAGHFDHNKMSNYFNELNCHLQCGRCNGWGLGEQYKYGKVLNQKYGPGTAEKIKRIGRKEKRWVGRDGMDELEKMNKNYLTLINENTKK